MPDVDGGINNLTNRCFHCGQTFQHFSELQAHLTHHKSGELRPSPPINFD